MHHVAVGDRTRATGVVACHTAQGGLRRGGHIDRKPQPERLELRIQVIQHHAGLHLGHASLRINRDHTVQVPAEINHQRLAHRLPALAGPSPPGQDRHLHVGRKINGGREVFLIGRYHHANWKLLVDRCVGRVAPARGGVELHLTLQHIAKTPRETAAIKRRRRGKSDRGNRNRVRHGKGSLGARPAQRPGPSTIPRLNTSDARAPPASPLGLRCFIRARQKRTSHETTQRTAT